MKCVDCGYWWSDVDDEGDVISAPYCHWIGPEEWAPCAQEDIEWEAIGDEAEYEAMEYDYGPSDNYDPDWWF